MRKSLESVPTEQDEVTAQEPKRLFATQKFAGFDSYAASSMDKTKEENTMLSAGKAIIQKRNN